MKRKYFVALALAMCVTNTVPALAAPLTNSVGSVGDDINAETVTGQDNTQNKKSEYDTYSDNYQGPSNVYATLASRFQVTIPKNIILDGSNFTGKYSVDVNGDFSVTEKVTVVPETSFTMHNLGNKDPITATVSQDKTEWKHNETDINAVGTVTANNLSAGSWNGSFSFNIGLKDSSIGEGELKLDTDGDVLLGAGETYQVNAYVDGKIANDTVTWESNNSNVSVVNGLVETSSSAKAGDEAIVTVTANSSQQLSKIENALSDLGIVTFANAANEVSVDFKVTVVDIELSTYSVDIIPGESATVTATIIPDTVIDIVNWSQTAVSGLNLVKNGNSVEIKVASDMEIGKTYDVIATYRDFSKTVKVNIVSGIHEHVYVETITKQPTCTEEGEKTFTCECGDSYTEKIPATGHNYEDDTCIDCGDKKVTYSKLRSSASETTDSNGFLGSSSKDSAVIRRKIMNITFQDYTKAEGHYITDNNCWDVSATQDGSIIAWYTKNSANGWYNIFVAPTSEGTKIQAPTNASYMFANLYTNSSAKPDVFGLENVDFSKTTNMSHMFDSTPLSYFKFNVDTSSVTDISYMFKADSFDPISSYVTFGELVDFSKVTNSDYFFSGQDEMTKVSIPKGLTVIGKSAFSLCRIITTITIPDSVTKIDDSAFSACNELSNIDIPSSVVSIGKNAFSGTAWLTARRAENPLVMVNGMLVDGSSLTGEVIIPDGIKTIPKEFLANCNKITSVIIPDSVTSIESGAFKGCSELTNITIGNNVTSIGDEAFYECKKLTNVVIPNSVTSIGKKAFYYCTSFTNITIPNSVTSIGESAFYWCEKVSDLSIGSGVTIINDSAFDALYKLQHITVDDNNLNYKSIDDILYSKDESTIFLCPQQKTGSVVIPDSVTNIESAFYGCGKLTDITIGKGITEIGRDAFTHCSGLTNITIPDNVTKIKMNAFSYCYYLNSVIIGENVTAIEYNAFYDCNKLTSVIFKNTDGWYITKIKDATSGTNITVTDPSINANNFKETSYGGTYYGYYWYRK